MQLQPAILLFAVGQCWTTAAGATVALPDDLRTGIHGIFIFITLFLGLLQVLDIPLFKMDRK